MTVDITTSFVGKDMLNFLNNFFFLEKKDKHRNEHVGEQRSLPNRALTLHEIGIELGELRSTLETTRDEYPT